MAEKVVEVDPAVLAGLDNYKNLPAVQQPNWPDQQALEAVHRELQFCLRWFLQVRSTSCGRDLLKPLQEKLFFCRVATVLKLLQTQPQIAFAIV